MLFSYEVNESQSSVTIWTETGTMIFSGRKGKQKGNYCMISFMFDFKIVDHMDTMNKVVGLRDGGWGWVRLKVEDWPVVVTLFFYKTGKSGVMLHHGHLKMLTKYCAVRKQ